MIFLKKILTIAGSDCSGGAGIQADIKTITVHKAYAMSVITALTAQNTMGVYGIFDVSAEFVSRQLDCIFTDIFPDAVKIGMVSNTEIIQVITEKLKFYKPKNIVLDPVMISTSGRKLLQDSAITALINKLFPLADIVTPNIPETEFLTGMSIKNQDDVLKVSEEFQGNVLIKGGHFDDTADDLLIIGGEKIWFRGEKINNPNSHGTGCTLSSAIACNLAHGYSLADSVKKAKDYISGALKNGLNLGIGNGPLNHFYF